MNQKDILLRHHQSSQSYSDSLTNDVKNYLNTISSQCYNQKGVFTVITTLITHKIFDPEQDIRLHQSNMENGFSGRSIDTRYITPTLKELGYPSMAESGWLTRSLEQPYPYNFSYDGKISGKGVKDAFLKTIDSIENDQATPEDCLKYLLNKTKEIVLENKVDIIPLDLSNKDKLTIEIIINFLDEQFSYKYGISGGSKLPVIALHTVYSYIVKELKRYEGGTLKDLGSHTASDRTSRTSGDIEIYKENELFEAVEVKLDKAIDANMVRVARDKIYQYSPDRYYILSNIGLLESEKENIYKVVKEIESTHGCQIILNGLLPTIKYYLRLISSLDSFMDSYLINIENDTEIKKAHKEVCNQLVAKYFQ